MNKPGLIIILYDDNERIAPQAATVFVEKGVENVFLLSGGDPFVLSLCIYMYMYNVHVHVHVHYTNNAKFQYRNKTCTCTET